MTPFPKNPFRPGADLAPAHMGSWPETEDTLLRLLRRLRDDDEGGEMAFLFGPRGSGKTVMLRWLYAEAAAAKVATVALVPENLDSPAGLTEAVRAATERFPKLRAWISMVEAGVGGGRTGFASNDSAPLLANLLNHDEDGLLLTVDDAHEARPDMLGRILNDVQLAGRNRPVAVVFAGTPGLESVLRASRTSFWSRGRMLRVGPLDDGSARAALAQPFQDVGLEVDAGAVIKLAAAADNYPYFLQLYGQAAWQMVEQSGGRALLPQHVAPALAAANEARRDYYLDRCKEFSAAGLLPVARRVAEAFVASAEAPAARRLTDAALDALLASEEGDNHREFLCAKGYAWQDIPGDPSWAPGIPGLMDYVLENASAA